MNTLRLIWQHVLSSIAIPFSFNDKLTQFCDRCGRTHYLSFWAEDVKVWEAVMGNVNGHHHGAVCVPCFSILAKEKGLRVDWTPRIQVTTL